MERIYKGLTSKDEEIFRFFDDLRASGIKDPAKAVKLLKEEFGIEERLGVIHMRRYTSLFGDPDKMHRENRR